MSSDATDEGSLSEVLEERRSKGEYVNELEDPIRQQTMKESIARGVEMLAPKNRANLAPLFARFGLADATGELLLQHVGKINEAAMEVGAMIQQLEKSRVDYDAKVRSLLSPQDYELYRQHESLDAARREFEKIMRFAGQERQAIPDNEHAGIIALIQETRAYPNESYLGPYDGLPVVGVGKESVLRIAEQRLRQITDGANQSFQLLSGRGFSEISARILFDYYSQDVRKRNDDVTRLQDPHFEEKMREAAERRLREMVERVEKERLRN